MPASRAKAALTLLPRRGSNRIAAVLALAGLSLAACASEAPIHCAAFAQKPTAEIVFGRVSPGARGVSEVEFARFMRQEVDPRFPDGLTVVDAQGRWTPPAGSAIHDPSKVVTIVLRGTGDERAKLEAVRTAYKRRFHQNAVLMLTNSGCVST
jgi:hypothetical protein